MVEVKNHRNDIYGDIENPVEEKDSPVIHAATVVLLRDKADVPEGSSGQVEVLMLQKNANITFGGMWVFPGGRIDAEDYQQDGELKTAARVAAARETEEEAGLKLQADEFTWFSHWTPPPGPKKRFATWFFVARANSDAVVTVDGGEILNHRWINPGEALKRHGLGEIDLVPPTWLTLNHINQYSTTAAALDGLKNIKPKIYKTRVVKAADGVRVAMWTGDAGYEDSNPDVPGERHRLVMGTEGFVFENTVEKY